MPLPEAAILTYERTKVENFQNTLNPNFDLYVMDFICTNFKAFTTFGAIFIFIHCTIFLSISFSHISGRTNPMFQIVTTLTLPLGRREILEIFSCTTTTTESDNQEYFKRFAPVKLMSEKCIYNQKVAHPRVSLPFCAGMSLNYKTVSGQNSSKTKSPRRKSLH